jgi:hypothetical protein
MVRIPLIPTGQETVKEEILSYLKSPDTRASMLDPGLKIIATVPQSSVVGDRASKVVHERPSRFLMKPHFK